MVTQSSLFQRIFLYKTYGSCLRDLTKITSVSRADLIIIGANYGGKDGEYLKAINEIIKIRNNFTFRFHYPILHANKRRGFA